MTVRHHYNINLPVEFVSVKLRDSNLTGHYEKAIPLQTFLMTNESLVTWLQSLNLSIHYGRYFNSVPGQVYYRHIDTLQTPGKEIINQADVVKLNLVFKSTGTKMTWFKLLEGKTGVPRINAAGDKFITYPDDSVVEIYTAQADNHCIVDGGTIHNLTNGENKGRNRYCYSLWLRYHNNPQQPFTWDSAVKLFEPYIY